MSKLTPKKNTLETRRHPEYHDAMNIRPAIQRLILGPLLVLLSASCAPRPPDIECTELQSIRMNRIPAGPLFLRDPARPGKYLRVAMPPFFISVCEITRVQYAEFLAENPSALTPAQIADGFPETGSKNIDRPHFPVTHITREDARAYCRWLSRKTDQKITLPNELQWEYAACAGIRDAPYAWGWGDPSSRAAWNTDAPSPVARHSPNGYGLYDMSGNVYEWCETLGPAPEGQALLRGGAWSEKTPEHLQIRHKTWVPSDYQDADAGFRVVMHPQKYLKSLP